MNIRQLSPEVLYAVDELRSFGPEAIREVMARAGQNRSGKCRICLHRSVDDQFHEMLIALRRDVIYPPHRFLKGEETHLALFGLAVLRVYDERGLVRQTIPMGSFDSGRASYVRLPRGCFHDLEVESDICVYLETKQGPFRVEDNEIAPFPGARP